MADKNPVAPVTPTDEVTETTEATATEVPETTIDESVVVEETKIEEASDEKLPGTEIHSADIKAGMTIRVHERIKDLNAKGEERERIQVFQGMVLGVHGSGLSKTFTIRRENKGFGVEKIYPLSSPVVTKVELVKTAKVRRSKLAYLQDPRRRFKRKLKETRAVSNS
jgi:large subunit ribosomal protein L19